jgi:arylsulfatase
MGWPEDQAASGSLEYFQWFKFQFWRFVFVQDQVMKLAKTAIEYPPMQKGASFNLDAVKEKIAAARAAMAK